MENMALSLACQGNLITNQLAYGLDPSLSMAGDGESGENSLDKKK
jgi:hypothetical protein